MPEGMPVVEVKDNIKIITLNRPKALNALNSEIVRAIGQAVADTEAEDNIVAIVITGAGRAFAAGADIAEFAGKNGEEMGNLSRGEHQAFSKIRKSTKPVIAAINGLALGGGCELAMSCHIRVASDRAVFGQPEVGLGAIPGAGGTQLLPRLVGTGAELYYLLTAENIPAAEAYRLGLVDKLVPRDKVMVTAMAIAKVIGQKAPVASRLILEAVNKGMELSLDESLELEEAQWRKCGDTEDLAAGVKGFMERKPVVFKGK